MRSRSRPAKPSLYPLLPFHFSRTLSLLSSIIVLLVLAFFAFHLKSKGYKLPWAFLVLIITSTLSILNLLLTTILHCCNRNGLSPRFSLTLNSILSLLWAISLGLLSWCMANTIQTSCTTTYWGTSTGITVCRIYKTLYAFTVLGTVSHLASICLDIVARNRQTQRRLGEYTPMPSDVKLEDRYSSNSDSNPPALLTDDVLYQRLSMSNPVPGSDIPTAPSAYTHRSGSGSGSGDFAERSHQGEAAEYYHSVPARARDHASSRADTEGTGTGGRRVRVYSGDYGHRHRDSEATRLVSEE